MLDFNSCSKTTSLCFQGLGFGVLSRAGSPLPVFPALPDPRVQAGASCLALAGVYFAKRRILHTRRSRDEVGSDWPKVIWGAGGGQGCLCLCRGWCPGTVSPGMAGRAGTRLGIVVHKVTFEDNVATYC